MTHTFQSAQSTCGQHVMRLCASYRPQITAILATGTKHPIRRRKARGRPFGDRPSLPCSGLLSRAPAFLPRILHGLRSACPYDPSTRAHTSMHKHAHAHEHARLSIHLPQLIYPSINHPSILDCCLKRRPLPPKAIVSHSSSLLGIENMPRSDEHGHTGAPLCRGGGERSSVCFRSVFGHQAQF